MNTLSNFRLTEQEADSIVKWSFGDRDIKRIVALMAGNDLTLDQRIALEQTLATVELRLAMHSDGVAPIDIAS